MSYYEYLSHYYTYQYNDTTDSSLKRILVNIGGSNGFILSNTYDDFSSGDLDGGIQYLVTPLGTVRKHNGINNFVIYEDIPYDPNHPDR